MLSKYQSRFYKLIPHFYKFLPEIPIRFDETSLRIYTLPKKRWYPYYVSMTFVLILWFNCVYLLGSALFVPREMGAVHYCMFICGFLAFGVVLLAANGLIDSNIEAKLGAVNEYLQFELLLQRKYRPELCNPKFGMLDIGFLIMNVGHIIPYVLFAASMYWNLDGPYFIIQDWVSKEVQEEPANKLLFIGIRSFFLIPGFFETSRSIIAAAPIFLYMITSARQTVSILTYRVKDSEQFFGFYMRFTIIFSILEDAILRLFLVLVTICYCLFVQSGWILIRGVGQLQPTVYSMFVFECLMLNSSVLIFMPQVSHTAYALSELNIVKKSEMKMKYLKRRTFANKVAIKRAGALQKIRFSYGMFYPLGANFCRNLFANGMEDLMTMVLCFKEIKL